MKRIVVVLLILNVCAVKAQTAITGYVSGDESNASYEVHLGQIALEDHIKLSQVKKIASTRIDKNGFFEFKKQLIADKNAIYKVYVNQIEAALKDTLQVGQLFILSKKDSIHFKKSRIPFTSYVNSNLANKEWQKLKKFEQKLRPIDLKKEDSLSTSYIGNIKAFTKDSLEILMVKLIGLKQLDSKELLAKDILKNPAYYSDLLAELRASEIDRSQYLFLENKLAFIKADEIEKKYVLSKWLIALLTIVIVGLGLFVFKLKQRKLNVKVDLSRQEKNVQSLILKGMSNKEIANELYISLNTVKTHITNIYAKLQVSNRQELVRKFQNL